LSDPTPRPVSLPENSSPLNQAAVKLLRQAKQSPHSLRPFVLQLATWGFENQAPLTSAGERHCDVLEQSLGLLLAEKPEIVMWYFRHHDPAVEEDPEALLEREEWLAGELAELEPLQAASLLLDVLMDSLMLLNSALRP
jgi:hypothetical protein